ncbi:hypothetical protein GLOIN_2v1789397 [Rhizophagus irregularis DAOM 181602=DAOM 197198]|nr:hypothetical protein GLOIN_2v1789397 [Rhizophagus irregularis DAOM 181602=DAOM 197198]
MEGKEISDYPENLNIKWKNNKRTFYYKIVKEGIYPREYILCQTKKPNQYPIPHGYIVQTSWNQNMCPVQCTIIYINDKPMYQVEFVVVNVLKLEKINKLYYLMLKNINPESNTQISGVFLFGLHLKFVQQNPKKQKNEAIVMAIDKGQISRNMYRDLAAIESELPREWAISDQRMQINKEMRNRIKITTINMPSCNNLDLNENPDIFDPEVVKEVITSIGKGGQRSIKDILRFIVPSLVERKILDLQRPIIYLKISGDSRNVGRKVKHVMVTFAIMDDITNLHRPDHHHTLVLYPGCENYDSLSVALSLLRTELRKLSEIGINIIGVNWIINLYFSSDWKFLSICCLGFNSANSQFFCPWCGISKKQVADLGKQWSISKEMSELKANCNTYDENGYFNDIAREIIVKEMNRIKVKFQFWQERESKTRNFTSLVGGHKLKVLQFFDLGKVLPLSRVKIIRRLWDEFHELYVAMRNPATDSETFKKNAEYWLRLFLTPSIGTPNDENFVQGLYRPNDLTPYFHVLVYHVHEFMEKTKEWGLKAFLCAPVEKKNH